eukprot:TRINITY_DN33_c0_g1_i1.p1 TRINITY_DN33_c0_g1~~TRINITY_DN33_c0_g1_i1.p1  ORF type:complete len:367 (-),score=63.91 TRINITY_DN33_c0_g1_i1:56-1156(-)
MTKLTSFLFGSLCLVLLAVVVSGGSPSDGYSCNSCGDPAPANVVNFQCVTTPSPTCSWDSCDGDAKDCNDDFTDGCEVDSSSDANNCGGCGIKCSDAFPGSNSHCANSVCVFDSCLDGFVNCGQLAPQGCLNSSTTPCPICDTFKARKKHDPPHWNVGELCQIYPGEVKEYKYKFNHTDALLSNDKGIAYLSNRSLVLEFAPHRSGNTTFNWVLSTNYGLFPFTTTVDIKNARPHPAFHSFQWNAADGAPQMNLLSNCTDVNGDELTVVGLSCNPKFLKSPCYSLSALELYFDYPAYTIAKVNATTGDLQLFNSVGNYPSISYGTPIDNTWAYELSFFFQIWDFDVDSNDKFDQNSVSIQVKKPVH